MLCSTHWCIEVPPRPSACRSPDVLVHQAAPFGLPSGGTFCVFGWNEAFHPIPSPARPVGAFSLELPAVSGTSLSRNQRPFSVHTHDTRRPRPKPPSHDRATRAPHGAFRPSDRRDHTRSPSPAPAARGDGDVSSSAKAGLSRSKVVTSAAALCSPRQIGEGLRRSEGQTHRHGAVAVPPAPMFLFA